MKKTRDPQLQHHWDNIASLHRCWEFADLIYPIWKIGKPKSVWQFCKLGYRWFRLGWWVTFHVSRKRMVLDIANMQKLSTIKTLGESSWAYFDFAYYVYREIVSRTQGRAYLRAIDPERKGATNV